MSGAFVAFFDIVRPLRVAARRGGCPDAEDSQALGLQTLPAATPSYPISRVNTLPVHRLAPYHAIKSVIDKPNAGMFFANYRPLM
jgi:hypothetical protein